MTKLVLAAFLAAAGCNKSADCGAAIRKGIDHSMTGAKTTSAGSPAPQASLSVPDKLKAAMTQRCNDDRWSPEAVACYGEVRSPEDLKACETRLTRDQRTKLDNQVFPITMGGMGANGSRTPPDLEGHAAVLRGATTPPGEPTPPAAPAAPPPVGSATPQ